MESFHTVSLKFAHEVQHSSLILEQSFCSNFCVRIKENGDKSDDPQNNPVVTPDTLFAELEKGLIPSFSEVGVSPIVRR
jgi:hypothetical protein